MLGPRVQRLADTVDEFQLDCKSNQNSRGSPCPLEGSPPMSIVNGVCQSNRLASRCPPRLPSCAYRPYQSQRLRGNIDAIHRDVVRSGIRHIGELAGRMNGDRGGRRWLFKNRTMAIIVFQFRVVAGTPNTLSIWPRSSIVFMWRRYTPKTNRLFDTITRTNHSSRGGSVRGMEARQWPAFDRMLTNRTISGRDGSVPNGFSISRRIRWRPSQSTTSASNGSFRRSSARNFPRGPGFRTTNVPAAPTFTTG